MVDVRVGADAQIDCSDVVARKLRELGASTVKRFTPKLTHMVLSHFTPVWKTKIGKWQAGGGSMAAAATRYELKIVSQLWVNACYVSKKRMDELPFFPVSQQNIIETNASRAKPKLKRRQSLGSDASKTDNKENTDNKASSASTEDKKEAAAAPPSKFKVNKALNGGRRKRRALSMEPATSDAILKMLGTSEPVQEAEFSTPTKQPIRLKSVSSSAKRRKTLNGLPTQQDEDEVTASQASGIVAESESENEDESKDKTNDVIVIQDSQASQPSPAQAMILLDSTGTPTTSNGELDIATPDDSKQPTARELRRRNRNSLSYGSGLTLKTGIWSCAACGCSNPRTRRYCTDCQASRGSAKSPGADSTATASPATVASTVADSPKTPATPTTTVSAPATPKGKTPTSNTKARTPGSANSVKTPLSSPSMRERTPRSLTRPTASSTAKIRTPSPAASRAARASTKSATPSPANRSRTQSPVARSVAPKPTARSSLASASVSIDKPKAPVKKAKRKLPATASAIKLTQSAAKKRARPPVSSSSLTTPVVKKARRENRDDTVNKMVTPGSVSGFMRKHREVNSTPIPMAMSFSSTTSRKTPRKSPRNVFGITGVSAEARGVLQCAIHAIDANMANEPGYRKARVVKSMDYAAGVTHLIVGRDARRTIKVLFAIARGAWIVTEDWAFSSLEQERWLPEEDFELTMFANKYSREHPESRQVFKGTKFFVGSNVEPSREVLQSLIQVAGGELCNQISVADICICGDASLFRRAQRTGIRVVTSKWVFDSIAAMKLEDDANYAFTESFGTPAKTPIKSRRAVECFGTPALTPAKSRSAAASGLEAHSTVPE